MNGHTVSECATSFREGHRVYPIRPQQSPWRVRLANPDIGSASTSRCLPNRCWAGYISVLQQHRRRLQMS
jgi:hypothetical protein